MHDREIFKRLGLPKHAALVYGLLRSKGPMLATAVSHGAQLHRPSVYRALSSLLTHRFVYTTMQGKRKCYHAGSPRIITEAFSETSEVIANSVTKQLLEDEKYKQKEICFLSGAGGIRAAFDDVTLHMKRGETFYRYTSEKDLDKVNAYLSRDYRRLRDQKKLERMVISNPASGVKKKRRLERFVKYIPQKTDQIEQNIIQLIYGDRISLIDLNTERVVIIENKALADFQKAIFKQLYEKLPLP